MPKSKAEPDELTTSDKVKKYGDLMPLFAAMCKEFQEASRKKPEAVLNKRKVEIINRLLKDILEILADEETHSYLDLLDEDDLPQNSDVSLMMGQIMAAMEAFRERYYKYDASLLERHWRVRA